MKLLQFTLLALLFGVSSLPQTIGLGEVTNPSPGTLRMGIYDEIRFLNASESPIVYDEETNTTPIQMRETDDEVGIEIYAQNQKFHRITITEAIDNKKRPVYLCYNNYMINYAYNQVNISFCENYKYGTMLTELRQGQSTNFEIPPIINGSNAWSIWVGRGAGGVGGIPVCEGMTISWTKIINATYTTGGDFNSASYSMFSWYVGYYGSSYVGCVPQGWEAQDYSTTRTIYWRPFQIDLTNSVDWHYNETNSTSANLFSSCASTSLGLGSSGNCLFANFHLNNTCQEYKNITTRARVYGTVSSNSESFYSPTITYAVRNNEYLGAEACNPQVTNNVELPPNKKDRFNPLFLALLPLTAFILMQKKKDKNTPPPKD